LGSRRAIVKHRQSLYMRSSADTSASARLSHFLI
jgi:hypothetical protein